MVFDKSNMLVYIIKSATDLCGNTITNSGVGAGDDEAGFSNGALDFADTSDRLEFNASVGNDVAVALNDACTILFSAKLRTLASDDISRVFHQWNNTSGQFAYVVSALNGYGSYTHNLAFAYSTNGSSNTSVTSDNNCIDNNWNDYVITSADNSTNCDNEIFKNEASCGTGTNQYTKTNSTLKFRIGARNGDNTQGDLGLINNIQIHKKVLSKAERHFASKWGNKKRIA